MALDIRTGRLAVVRGLVPRTMIEPVVRMLYLDLKAHGLRPGELLAAHHNPFGHLVNEPPVLAIVELVGHSLEPPGTICHPHQLVWHLPDEAPADYPLSAHVDVPPEGTRFTCIVGVALSPWNARNGTVHVWQAEPINEPWPVLLDPGDAVVMHPDTLHSPGLNRSAEPRIGLYVRWKESR